MFHALERLLLLITLPVLLTACHKDTPPPSAPDPAVCAWVVGDADSTGFAVILFTSDGGTTWQRQGLGSPVLSGINLNNVKAVDKKTVWAVGTSGTIVKTTDGGASWQIAGEGQLNPAAQLTSLTLAGSKQIWTSGEDGYVYHSADAGATWKLMDRGFFRNGLMQGVLALNEQTIYVVGGYPLSRGYRGFVARTINGGVTWDTVSAGGKASRFEWIGMTSSGPDHLVIYGQQSHYLFSRDAGITWSHDSVPGTGGGTGGADINCLTMTDTANWWGAFDYDAIFLTSDSGASWTRQESDGPGGMWLFGIDWYNRDVAVITGLSSLSLSGKIISTTDGGNTWRLTYSSRSPLCKVSFVRP